MRRPSSESSDSFLQAPKLLLWQLKSLVIAAPQTTVYPESWRSWKQVRLDHSELRSENGLLLSGQRAIRSNQAFLRSHVLRLGKLSRTATDCPAT